ILFSTIIGFASAGLLQGLKQFPFEARKPLISLFDVCQTGPLSSVGISESKSASSSGMKKCYTISKASHTRLLISKSLNLEKSVAIICIAHLMQTFKDLQI
ncbi:hypothetical protein Q2352_26570, partial [Escherichia coli]|nr:hypothetical protein [Escherichia coli]